MHRNFLLVWNRSFLLWIAGRIVVNERYIVDIIGKGFKTAAYSLLGAGFGVLIQLFLARYLGSEDYGRFSYNLGIANTIGLFLSFGFSFYLPKVLPNASNSSALFSSYFYSVLIVSLGLIPALHFVLSYSSQVFESRIVVILYALVTAMVLLMRSYLVSKSKAELASLLGGLILRILMLSASVLSVVIFEVYTETLMAVLVVVHLFVLIPFLLKNLQFVPPRFDFIKVAGPLFLIQILYTFFNEFSRVIQGEMFGLREVGYLSLSLVLAQLLNLIGQNFATVSLPIFTKAFAKKDYLYIEQTYHLITRLNAFVILPIFLAGFILSRNILMFIDADYGQGSIILRFILFGSFFASVVGPNGSILMMSSKSNVEIINGVVKIVCVIALVLSPLKNNMWIVAAALATSEIVVNTLKMLQVSRFFNIRFIDKRSVKYLVKSSVLNSMILVLLSALDLSPLLLMMLLSIVTGLFVYFNFKLSPYDGDREILNRVIS